jgi:hypothetical protein
MLIWARGLTGDRRRGRSEVTVEEVSDPPRGDAYVYALREEAAYLQTDEDEKPELIPEPPEPAQVNCWFCRKTDRQVLFGAEYPVRDPNNFANETLIFICGECVAEFAERLAQGSPEGPPPH